MCVFVCVCVCVCVRERDSQLSNQIISIPTTQLRIQYCKTLSLSHTHTHIYSLTQLRMQYCKTLRSYEQMIKRNKQNYHQYL